MVAFYMQLNGAANHRREANLDRCKTAVGMGIARHSENPVIPPP